MAGPEISRHLGRFPYSLPNERSFGADIHPSTSWNIHLACQATVLQGLQMKLAILTFHHLELQVSTENMWNMKWGRLRHKLPKKRARLFPLVPLVSGSLGSHSLNCCHSQGSRFTWVPAKTIDQLLCCDQALGTNLHWITWCPEPGSRHDKDTCLPRVCVW